MAETTASLTNPPATAGSLNGASGATPAPAPAVAAAPPDGLYVALALLLVLWLFAQKKG